MVENRKIQYTKHILSTTLIELLKDNHISQISVSQLCEEANINRTTFYRYYTDVLALLNEIENKVVNDLLHYLNQFNAIRSNEEILSILELLVRYILNHEAVFGVIMAETKNFDFKQKFINVFYTHIENIYADNIKQNEEKLTYILYGSIALIQNWLSKKIRSTPHQMANLMLDFGNRILND